mgnify:CR=1 FL=1
MSERDAALPDAIRLRLDVLERALLLDYGYPFPDLRQALERLVDRPGEATVSVAPFYIEMLVADLVRSAKEISDEALLEELDALCTNLELQAARQDVR